MGGRRLCLAVLLLALVVTLAGEPVRPTRTQLYGRYTRISVGSERRGWVWRLVNGW